MQAGGCSVEELSWDNSQLRRLPVLPEAEQGELAEPRSAVAGACFSRARPTPLDRPRLVVACPDALALFGLSPEEARRADFAELFCGRLAMMGFTVGLAEEIATGQGILAQINVSAPGVPNPIALAFLTALIVGGTGYGSAKTLASAQNGTMTLRTFKRWCDLLGADQDAVAEKLRVDLTKMESAGKSQADILSTVTKDGYVTFAESDSATALLSMDAKAESFAAAEKMKAENATVAVSFSTDELDASSPNVNLPRLKPVGGGVSADMKYALDVEMNNGRWAMMGFALAVWTEACTGQGIMGQLVFAAKATGVLGPDSGF